MSRDSADQLRRDLAAAGIPYRDERNRVLDFHALRHTFGSNLAKAGVPPKMAQELMRHSDVNLTLKRYSHVGLHDLAGAVEQLPAIPAEQPTVPTRTDSVVALGTSDIRNTQELSGVSDEAEGGLPSGPFSLAPEDLELP